MHELAVCQALLAEVRKAAGATPPGPLTRIVVKIGPLSGVEPELLSRAFEVARAGGIAAEARLVLEPSRVRVECLACQAQSDASPSRLLCPRCGGWRTRVVAGDELLLQRLEFTTAEETAHV